MDEENHGNYLGNMQIKDKHMIQKSKIKTLFTSITVFFF